MQKSHSAESTDLKLSSEWKSKLELTTSKGLHLTMLNIKAGRAFRRGDSTWVDPQPAKGTLALAPGDDGLLHLTWKNRDTNNVEDVNFNVLSHFAQLDISPGLDYYPRRRVISSCGRCTFWTRFRLKIRII